MSLSFEVQTDVAAIKTQVKETIAQCLPILSMQILMDCNYFCKQDQGTLISSSISASDVEHGDLIWDTLYANRQYWLPSTCTDVNSNAAHMWCHKAFDRFGSDWERLLQKLLDEPENRAAMLSQLHSAAQNMGQ